MWVSVMNIMRVRVRMGQCLVPMRMGVRHLFQLSGSVLVLMVLVVLVFVGVLEGPMGVCMFVHVGAEQESAPGHAQKDQKRRRMDRFM